MRVGAVERDDDASKLVGGEGGQIAVEQGAAAGVGDGDAVAEGDRAGKARQAAQIERAAAGVGDRR